MTKLKALRSELNMNDFEIQTSSSNGILEVVFGKPKVNAICAASSRKLSEIFLKFKEDPKLHVAIFTTAGGIVFSGGWDLKAAEEGEDA